MLPIETRTSLWQLALEKSREMRKSGRLDHIIVFSQTGRYTIHNIFLSYESGTDDFLFQ